MGILDLTSGQSTPVSTFGSRAFSVAGLLRSDDAHMATVRLGPGGIIGRHPTVTMQLLVVLKGEATVSGEDDRAVTVGPGNAALWQPGEHHETRTASGLVALVIEGELRLHGQC
jgi:quercetin dioxygenase-like cupin family protein